MDYMLKKRLKAVIFPTRCPICGAVIFPHEDFCAACRGELTEYSGNFTVWGADGFTAAYEYNEKISPSVILLKRGVKGNAAYALGKALAERVKGTEKMSAVDVIIPVPLYSADKRRRGFNQAELIAKEVGRIIGVEVCCDFVVKTRRTSPQKTLTRRERRINLRDAFDVEKPEIIHQRRVLLIDDVCTTGSTLIEITRLLRRKGAAAVYCAVCCKTPEINTNP